MGLLKIDGNLFKRMVFSAAYELNANSANIDSLNVFPVPDGDTGTNMSLTLIAAVKEIAHLSPKSVYEVAKVLADGTLRGARGNSGVILSQLFRGFAKGIEGKVEIDARDLSNAFAKAVETAYKAIMKPKEGTILTVATAISEKTMEYSYDSKDLEEILTKVISYANKVLEQTKDMLPQLKEAGVVDAGGKGLLCIMEGAMKARHSEINYEFFVKQEPVKIQKSEIKYCYCTELLINVDKPEKSVESLKSFLDSIGDSIVLVNDEKIIKLHVHTNNPGKVVEYALQYGELSDIKIENMRIQHTKITKPSQPNNQKEQKKSQVGFVTIATGKGIYQVFKDLGVDQIIEGGQSMNPSAEDILAAIDSIDKPNIIILPNNKNIVLAAQQAAQLCKSKTVNILPTTTIPQGVSAMVNFLPFVSLEENLSNMTQAIESVTTGLVTYSVRDSVIFGKEINEGDYLCLIEHDIALAGSDLQACTKALIDSMVKLGGELITIYYGADTSEDDAQEIMEYLRSTYPEFDYEVHDGMQPLYYYIISIE